VTGLGEKKGEKEEEKRKKCFCDVNGYGESESAFVWTGVRLAGPAPAGQGDVVGGRDERPPKRDTG
jgi:hypothetical protein